MLKSGTQTPCRISNSPIRVVSLSPALGTRGLSAEPKACIVSLKKEHFFIIRLWPKDKQPDCTGVTHSSDPGV